MSSASGSWVAVCPDCTRSWPRWARFCGLCGCCIPVPQRRFESRGVVVAGTALGVLVLLGLGGGLGWAGVGGEREAPASHATATLQAVEVIMPVQPRDEPWPTGTPPEPEAAYATCLSVAEPCTIVSLSGGESVAAVKPLGERAVVLASGGQLVRSELPSGVASWRTELPLPSGPVQLFVAGGLVFVAVDGLLLGLDPTSGEPLWRATRPEGGAVRQVWQVADGVAVLDERGRLAVHHPLDGRVLRSEHGVDGASWGGAGPAARRPLLPVEPRTDVAGARVGGAVPANLGEVSVRWAVLGHEAVITAFDPGGQMIWHTGPLPLLCCTPTAVAGPPGQLVIAGEQRSGAVLDAVDGRVLTLLESPDGVLAGSQGRVGVWRTGSGVVGRSWEDSSLVFDAPGELVAVRPLLVDGPKGTVHIVLGEGYRPGPVHRPFR